MTTEVEPQHDGAPAPHPPYGTAPLPVTRLSARRAEDRADRRMEREERRRDQEHKRRLKEEARAGRVAANTAARAEKQRLKARRRKERRAAWQARTVRVTARLAAHMPLWGLPVVAVSMVMGWSGQMLAGAHLGMGWAAAGMPMLTEGMTLTFAGLTAQAIDQRRPYRWLMRATCVTALVAASINAVGHLIEDSSPAGMYRAGAYAGASLGALILWWVVMRSRRAAVSGRSAEEITRWRRLRRRHPRLVRRARRLADTTGVTLDTAFQRVWIRANGAGVDEPSIREIRASRRAAYRRDLAESWDGRRRFLWDRDTVRPAAEDTPADAPEDAPEDASAGVSEDVPEVVPAPYLPVALMVPGPGGQWVAHRVPVHPLTASQAPADGEAAVSPSGPDAAPADGPAASAPGAGAAAEVPGPRFPQGQGPGPDPVREGVDDDRLATVRAMVAEVREAGGDLMREPSARKTAKRLGCRPGTARRFLAQALAEHGITRPRRG
ncbi:hypothetical protein [Streptomyces chrestomyceticus]|uniref:hypothetical protein n=1 Tax=Streptomyces chrestomyceticus TaxID=68185 RepID=UPI0033C45EA2